MSDFVFSEQQDSFGFSDAHDDFDWKETAKGDPGATFIPDVSEQGIISWTNDGGLPNPQPRNIRGPKGDSLDLPQGGETGQILKKVSDEDYDVEWADAAEAQVQSDWTETDTDEPSYIQHKPDLSHFIDDSDYAPTAKTQDMIQPVGVDANGALWTAPGGDASSDMIADEYDAEKVDGYAVGDYCYRDGTLYRCNTAIPAGGETWTPAHWDECTVTEEIQTLQEDFSEFDEMSGIAVQDTAPSGRIKMWLDTDGNPIVLPEIDDEHTNLVDTWSSQKISDSIGAVEDDVDAVADLLAITQSGLAIIVDGDTCTMAVPVGGYAYITNNTHGLAEGLYTNTSASAFPTSGGTADGTVFTAVSDGGLNALNTQLINMFDFTAHSGSSAADSSLPSGVTKNSGSFNYRLNADKTFGAICSTLTYNIAAGTTNVNLHIPLGFSVKSIGVAHSIFLGFAYAFTWNAATGAINIISNCSLRIEANGDAYLDISNVYNNKAR